MLLIPSYISHTYKTVCAALFQSPVLAYSSSKVTASNEDNREVNFFSENDGTSSGVKNMWRGLVLLSHPISSLQFTHN